jgi:CHC2 zinc finger/Toprim domain
VATNFYWQVPTELPDLRRAGIIALDTETKDEGLISDRGPAWPWHGGHICGVSVAYHADGSIRSHYFPLRHPDTDNFDPARVFDWLKDLIASDLCFVTQNGLYDWGWLRADGGILMPPADRLEEIGALATLVDENRFSYGLDALCAWRGLPGKDETLLKQAVKAAGFAPKRKKINAQAHIWQLPAQYVGAYAEADAANTLALLEDLDPVLDREKTRDAYRLEIDLLPMVHEMRRRGIRVDRSAAEHARDLILQKRDSVLAELSEKLDAPTGMDEIGSPKWKAQTFDKHSIAYPSTAKGNPSFRGGNSGWMVAHPHWLPQLIAKATKYNGTANRFLKGHILDHIIDGRVYSEIHPHRSIDEPLVNDKVCCPFHDDSTPSCHIYSDHFHCFGCGAHGDAIDWLMMVEGLDRDAAIELLANWQAPSSQPHKNEDNTHTFANAMRLWEQAQPIAGTHAIQYLADVRRIDTGALPAGIEAVLRFHPRCPFGPGTRYPCLLALMRDGVADVPTGIQRIALTPEVLTGGKVERRMLGRAGTVKLWPAASSLVIGEGIETVLAAATRIPYRGAPLQPAWSTLTSGKLSTFPVLPGVERLIILVDHDINGAGQLAATVCTERWSRAGRTVVRLTPEHPGADFNDLVMPE